MMEGQELLDYVKEVKELETAVYANEQMCRGFQEKAQQNESARPALPALESESNPYSAKRVTAEQTSVRTSTAIIGGAIGTIVGLIIFILSDRAEFASLVLMSLFCGSLSLFF